MAAPPDAYLVIKPLAFVVAALPMAIDNIRTGLISNLNNAILFLGGIGVLALGPTLGMETFSLPAPSLWMLVALVPFALFALRLIGGGAAKFLIALLPWFSPGEYIFVTVAGFIFAGVAGVARSRKNMQILLPILVAGLLAQVAAIVVSMRH
jgi:Flp pilus assembly protein protease CpaA